MLEVVDSLSKNIFTKKTKKMVSLKNDIQLNPVLQTFRSFFSWLSILGPDIGQGCRLYF